MGAGTDYTSTESTDAGSIIQVIKLLHPVEFTDSSTGADNVLWDFGDGNTSTERNPLHNYSSNGTFIVTLTAYNEFGENSTSQTVIVSGIGVDFYEVEQPTEEETTEEETTEEETTEEETTEEDSLSYNQDVQTFDLDAPSMPELTLDKDNEDFGYDGDVNLDVGSTTTTEETTTQQTTQEQQSRKVEFLFQPFSPDGRSMIGMEVKDFLLVEGELQELQIGIPIKLIDVKSNKVHNRQVVFVINDEKNKGISIDAPIVVEDNFYRAETEV